MDTAVCDCCGRKNAFVAGFYLYRVCEVCGAELKSIANGEYSHSRNILVFYINAQACFLRKGECHIPPILTIPMDNSDLNTMAQWMQKMSRISLM